jgi:hypothetical protein
MILARHKSRQLAAFDSGGADRRATHLDRDDTRMSPTAAQSVSNLLLIFDGGADSPTCASDVMVPSAAVLSPLTPYGGEVLTGMRMVASVSRQSLVPIAPDRQWVSVR